MSDAFYFNMTPAQRLDYDIMFIKEALKHAIKQMNKKDIIYWEIELKKKLKEKNK